MYGSWRTIFGTYQLMFAGRRISIFLGNSLYLIAFSFYSVITFLGYNGMRAPLSPRSNGRIDTMAVCLLTGRSWHSSSFPPPYRGPPFPCGCICHPMGGQLAWVQCCEACNRVYCSRGLNMLLLLLVVGMSLPYTAVPSPCPFKCISPTCRIGAVIETSLLSALSNVTSPAPYYSQLR